HRRLHRHAGDLLPEGHRRRQPLRTGPAAPLGAGRHLRLIPEGTAQGEARPPRRAFRFRQGLPDLQPPGRRGYNLAVFLGQDGRVQDDLRFRTGRRPAPSRTARLAAALALALSASPLAAQTAVIEETAPAPRGARSDEVAGALLRDGSRTEMTYVTRMAGDLADGRTRVLEPEKTPEPRSPLPRNGSVSTAMVVLLLVGGLLLWLRFGGAGMLMSRAPAAQKRPVAAPDAWNISAADQTGHRRLPQGWRAGTALRDILTRAELAHYGGRPVAEEDFAATLDLGRAILLRGGRDA